MSISFRQYYVARPSIAPVSSGGSGTIQLVHRRVNKGNQRTAPSPTLANISLPATITPQTYSDTDSILRDEFLVSNDSGVTWKIVPSDNDHLGALSVPAFNSSWTTTTLSANQSSTGFNLNFGEFSADSSPSQVVYLLNIGNSINSLTFNFVDLITNQPLVSLAGRIQIEILGLYPVLGNNPDNSFNQSLIWDRPQVSLNTVSLLMPTFTFVKARISLINYPLGNLSEEAFNLSLSVTVNQTSFSLAYSSNWPDGSFLIDDDSPYRLPIIEEVDSTTFQINPFMVNQSGILRANLRTLTLEVVNGDRVITLSPSGNIGNYEDSDTIPSDHIVLAECTFAAGVISDLVYPWPIKPQAYSVMGETSDLLPNRFVTVQSDNSLEYTSSLGEVMGVSLYENSNLIGQLGLVWLELGGSVDIGEQLRPTTNGLAIAGVTGAAIALESGVAGDTIKAAINPYIASTGGSAAWGAIAGTLSDQTDLQSALDSKIDETLLTTKGDLISFGTSLGRLGVGSDGQVLSADSSEVMGLKWINAGSGGSSEWGDITGDITDQTDLIAEFDSRDDDNRARGNHTGTQLASTISDFSSVVESLIPVDSVAGKTGAVTLVKGDVGLGNVDNTSDLNKPISTLTQAALDEKVNETLLTTKGDLISFSTSLGRLGVGSDGQVLTADSTETLGLKWATSPSGVTEFSGLSDVPSYAGNANKALIVNGTEDGVGVLTLGTLATLGNVGDSLITDVAWGKLTSIPANVSTLVGWSSDQVSRAGALPSATSGAIEKTGANTFSTFAVTAAAKTVLDDSTVSAMLTTLGGAPLASPALTGTPTAPTATAGTNTTQIASTAFVQGEAIYAKWNADKLQGVNIQAATPTNGQILVYSSANSRWEPRASVIVLTLTPTNGYSTISGWSNTVRLYADGLAVLSFGVSRASQPSSTEIFSMSGYKAKSDAGHNSTHEMTNEGDIIRVSINANESLFSYFRVSGGGTSVTLVGTLTFPWEVA